MSSGPTLLILFSIDKVILHALLRWFLASKCGGFPENVIDSERKRDGKAGFPGRTRLCVVYNRRVSPEKEPL